MKPIFFPRSNPGPRPPESKNLNELHIEYGNEKANVSEHTEEMLKWHIPLPMHHTTGYAPIYEGIFGDLKDEKFKMMEIGICDWRFPFSSAKIYLRFFPQVEYWGYDLFLSQGLEGRKAEIEELNKLGGNVVYGDQSDPECLLEACKEITKDGELFKLVIDDGSHQADHIWTSLEAIWPYMKSDGWYIVEDLSSGWPYPLGNLSFGDNTADVWRAFYQLAKKIDPSTVKFDITDQNKKIIKSFDYTGSTSVTQRGNEVVQQVMETTKEIFFRCGRDGANWIGGFRKV